MILYGDPEYSIAAADARERLLGLIERLESEQFDHDLGRDLLIACGQVEQALADENEASASAVGLAEITDLAANLFLVAQGWHLETEGVWDVRRRIEALLNGNRKLRIKIPEGYAFYCLYPEQYVRAAKQWVANHPAKAPVLVVGIRSIGTALSALVAAVLRSDGIPVQRCTVRPCGHPFNRFVKLPPSDVKSAIVVDEGPGLSGSSMAAVVKAARRQNIADITLFPSHAGNPGAAATPETLQIWAETPRIMMPLIEGDWQSGPVFKNLRTETERLLDSPVIESHDLSGGEWRNQFRGKEPLPCFPRFERTKYLLRARNGRALFWKFAGVGPGRDLLPLALEAFNRQRMLAARGWSPNPLSHCDGFIGTEWIDGMPLTAADLDGKMIKTLARCIADAAKPASESPAQQFGRLRKMTEVNLNEAFGPQIARQFSVFAETAAASLPNLPSYGDGRVGPHEWIRSRTGDLFKTDVWGHDCDHTFVGEQSVLWDVAGAIVDWRMNSEASARFLEEIERIFGKINLAAVNFFVTAYSIWQIARYMQEGIAPPALFSAEIRHRLGISKCRHHSQLDKNAELDFRLAEQVA